MNDIRIQEEHEFVRDNHDIIKINVRILSRKNNYNDDILDTKKYIHIEYFGRQNMNSPIFSGDIDWYTFMLFFAKKTIYFYNDISKEKIIIRDSTYDDIKAWFTKEFKKYVVIPNYSQI